MSPPFRWRSPGARHPGADLAGGGGSASSEEMHYANDTAAQADGAVSDVRRARTSLLVAQEGAAGSAGRTESTSEHHSIDGCGLFLGLSCGPQA
jgi:hypothetical protein